MNLTSEQLKALAPLIKRREKITAELLEIEAKIKGVTGQTEVEA